MKKDLKDKSEDDGTCCVEGCNNYHVKTYGRGNIYCYSHLKKYDKAAISEKKAYDRANGIKPKRKSKTASPTLANPTLAEELLAPKNFSIKKEILAQGYSKFQDITEEELIGVESLKQRILAKWLNADQATRIPQDIKHVAHELKVSENKVFLWVDSSAVRKMRVEMLDDIMRFDIRPLAYIGFVKSIQNEDAKAIDRYMTTYVDKSKREDEKKSNLKDWLKKLAEEEPEEVKINKTSKVLNAAVEGLSIKAMLDN